MLFPTVEYAIFFIIVFFISWVLWQHNTAKKFFLLISSYLFYGCWNWGFVLLLLAVSLFSYGIAYLIQNPNPKLPFNNPRKKLLVTGIVVCLSLLFYYKYVGFFVLNILNLLNMTGVSFNIDFESPMLPLGISFFVFHAISLMGDAYRNKISVKITVVDTLLYIAFFPQLIAGPILRASSFLPQLSKPTDPTHIRENLAWLFIVCGLFKKVVISNFLATNLVDNVFSAPTTFGGGDILLAIYGYAGQIYCDFSGYTDIAIGCAMLLGYQFPKNFDAPYTAVSPQDFWHRWHISLSTWLRDYLYIPLGGSHGSTSRTYFNLFITMVLGGLWHGANWTFVIWGVLHGGYLVIHRLWSRWQLPAIQQLRQISIWTWVARFLTFQAVCLAWVFFRSPDFTIAFDMLKGISNWAMPTLATPLIVLMVLLGIFCQYFPKRWSNIFEWESGHWSPIIRGVVLALAIFLIEILGPTGVAPFIYFQF